MVRGTTVQCVATVRAAPAERNDTSFLYLPWLGCCAGDGVSRAAGVESSHGAGRPPLCVGDAGGGGDGARGGGAGGGTRARAARRAGGAERPTPAGAQGLRGGGGRRHQARAEGAEGAWTLLAPNSRVLGPRLLVVTRLASYVKGTQCHPTSGAHAPARISSRVAPMLSRLVASVAPRLTTPGSLQGEHWAGWRVLTHPARLPHHPWGASSCRKGISTS